MSHLGFAGLALELNQACLRNWPWQGTYSAGHAAGTVGDYTLTPTWWAGQALTWGSCSQLVFRLICIIVRELCMRFASLPKLMPGLYQIHIILREYAYGSLYECFTYILNAFHLYFMNLLQFGVSVTILFGHNWAMSGNCWGHKMPTVWTVLQTGEEYGKQRG